MHKITNGKLPAISSDDYLTLAKDTRKRKSNPKYKIYETKNIVDNYQMLHDKCYRPIVGNSTIYQNSFFPRTISDWNQLSVTPSESLDTFKAQIRLI